MRLAYLVVGCLPVLGQASVLGQAPVLSQASGVSSVTKAPGEKVTLELFADSQKGRAPVTLRWEVVFPAQVMEMGDPPETGSAAMDSGKSLQCNLQKAYSYVCVLAGGQKPIASGQIAIFHFKIRTTAGAGTTALRIERAVATAADSKEVFLNSTESMVVIR
jgi:hypothetical protein